MHYYPILLTVSIKDNHLEEYRKYYPKAIGFGILFIIGSMYFVAKSDKPREKFLYISGTISYLSPVHPLKSDTEARSKEIYLRMNGYDRVFELFTGVDKGDFSPRVNRLAELSVGDDVEVYFDDIPRTINDEVNKLLYYLDKNGELYYQKSRVDKYVGYFTLLGGVLLIILGIYMQRKSS